MTPAEQLSQIKAEKKRQRPRRSQSPLSGNRKCPLICHVAALRETLNISYRETADAVGISHATLYQIERGGSPTLITALKLAAFFGRPIEQIWTCKNDT